jgi:hypothetical protein
MFRFVFVLSGYTLVRKPLHVLIKKELLKPNKLNTLSFLNP